MSSLSTVRTRVLNLVSNSSMISSADATALIQAEHRTILDDYSWARRKRDVVINTTAPYSTGTVSSTGNVTVLGTSTAWTTAMVGSWFRASGSTFFHRITGVANAVTLTIESPGLPADLAAGSGYTIFDHLYDLPLDFGRATNVVSDTRLEEWSRTMLDRVDPFRTSTAARPDIYSIYGMDPIPMTSLSVFQIEFWPVPSGSTSVRIEYLASNSLVNDTDETMYRGDVLVWKGAETAAFFLHGKTGDLAWLALADRYHTRYQEALQGAREDDLGKYSPPLYIRDSGWNFGRGDDFYLDKDPLWLR